MTSPGMTSRRMTTGQGPTVLDSRLSTVGCRADRLSDPRRMVGDNDAMSTLEAESQSPTRMHSAVLSPIGDGGRAELVERRLGQAISGGVLLSGERLPSESELARSLRVSPVTVREALGTLRERGLITTRRGRNGGSFVTAAADPTAFARERLGELTRLALRDLGLHYLVIGSSCVALAAERAHPSELSVIRRRLERGRASHRQGWARHYDEALLELAALSQSARLTREQMKLQAEISPLLALIDDSDAHRDRQAAAIGAVLDAVASGDSATAADTFRSITRDNIDQLVELHEELHSAPHAPPTQAEGRTNN